MLSRWDFFTVGLIFVAGVLLNVSGWGTVVLIVAMMGANLLGYVEARSKDED